jgi:ATP-dependent Clp protease ATP-binding subunit ClpA
VSFYDVVDVQVMKEVEQAGDKIILFIDELHVMVGAGGSDGAIDASNILKPSLARGKLRCMGATTTDEYAKCIEKDPALARRFQSVYIPEPSAAHTVEILRGLRDKYETHHRVLIPDTSIDVAVQLTGRYLSSKKFPDKAIDLLDESMSRIRNRRERKPPALLDVEKRLGVLLCGADVVGSAEGLKGSPSADIGSGNRKANPAVEDCIRVCNSIVTSDSGTANSSSSNSGVEILSTTSQSVEEHVRKLRAQCETIQATWSSRNGLIASLFEARTILFNCLEQQRALKKSGGVDADGFLKRRIDQKEAEIRELCSTLMRTADGSPIPLLTSKCGLSLSTFLGQCSSRLLCVFLSTGGPDGVAVPVNTSAMTRSEELSATIEAAMRAVGNAVDEGELAGVISQSTGIPVSNMLGDTEKVPNALKSFTLNLLVQEFL